MRAEIQVREWNPVRDLGAPDVFRIRVTAREAEIARLRVACAQKLLEQQNTMRTRGGAAGCWRRLTRRRITSGRSWRERAIWPSGVAKGSAAG